MSDDLNLESEPISFHQTALKELRQEKAEFLLLRGPECWLTAKEVDLLARDEKSIDRLLKKLGYFCYSKNGIHRWYLRYEEAEKSWVHLDVHVGIELGKITASHSFIDFLFSEVKEDEFGIPHLEKGVQAILLLLHSLIDKRKVDDRYKRIILNIDRSAARKLEKFFLLPQPIDTYLQWVELFKKGDIQERKLVELVLQSFNIKQGKSWLTFPHRSFKRIVRMILGSGTIAVLGPDGAGKSSILRQLVSLPYIEIRGQYMGPGRVSEINSLLNLVIVYFARIREKYSKKHPFGVLARVLWHSVCYVDLLDRKWRHLWHIGKEGIVLFDRYACDIYFRKPEWFSEFLHMKAFPKPRFALLCVGDTLKIHSRKPELTISELNSTIDLYRKKLRQHKIPYIEINTTELSINQSVEFVVSELTKSNWHRC